MESINTKRKTSTGTHRSNSLLLNSQKDTGNSYIFVRPIYEVVDRLDSGNSCSVVDDFPCVSATHSTGVSLTSYQKYSSVQDEGYYLVYQVDIVGSSQITDKFGNKTSHKFTNILFETMNRIAVHYNGAKAKQGEGDAVYYIWKHDKNNHDVRDLEKMLDCSLQMINARDYINFRLYDEGLPPIDYRISGDYGNLIRKILGDGNEDYDGKAVNYCAKINKEAQKNSVIIGEDLYNLAKQIGCYDFEPVGRSKHVKTYPLFALKSKKTGYLVDPLRRTEEEYTL